MMENKENLSNPSLRNQVTVEEVKEDDNTTHHAGTMSTKTAKTLEKTSDHDMIDEVFVAAPETVETNGMTEAPLSGNPE